MTPSAPRTCSKCGHRAVIYVAYSGRHLCAEHFIEFFEKRVKKTLRQQGKIGAHTRITVALSGGKDSTVALHLLAALFGDSMRGTLSALTIDEGIAGYRPESIKLAEKTCSELGIEHMVMSFREEFGYTLDEMHVLKDSRTECTYCGVFRRSCLNTGARRLGAEKIATGHNLDDAAQSILMNVMAGDVTKLARMGPHKIVRKGFIPRIEPLRLIPEKEVALYALLRGIDVHRGVCPYAPSSERNEYRAFITEREIASPGTRHSIVGGYDKMADALLETIAPVTLGACAECGEPTAQTLCMKCTLLQQLNKNK